MTKFTPEVLVLHDYFQIDSVDTMSWQAQIKGKKLWTLQTPPECHSQCSPYMELVVEPGNIGNIFLSQQHISIKNRRKDDILA